MLLIRRLLLAGIVCQLLPAGVHAQSAGSGIVHLGGGGRVSAMPATGRDGRVSPAPAAVGGSASAEVIYTPGNKPGGAVQFDTTSGSSGSLVTGPVFFVNGKPASETQYRAANVFQTGAELLKQNKNQEAAAKFKEAIALSPDMPEPHQSLGICLAKLGDMDNAVHEMEQAVALNPKDESSWLMLGGLQQSSGKIDRAIDTYKQFLERFPTHNMKTNIQGLVRGLTAEYQRILAVQSASKALPPPASAASGDAKPAPAAVSAANADSDYVAEVTANGVMRWPASRMPIKVFIHPGVTELNGAPTGFKEEYRQLVARCFEDWSKASNGLVTFQFVNSPKDANLDVRWAYSTEHLPNPAEAGDAKMYMNREGLVNGTIQLLTKGTSAALPLTTNRLRVICLHEIGHALGLSGHTSNPDDIMFYSASFKDEWKELGSRDSQTIRRLYSNQ